ncbi:hypothetical protein SYNTR_0735 [Candidatus Syntrophocurvum alkaliphilum]|uniref:ATP-grasp domain-containing protein n=1 Tax=Candidatus Syntrophocurvum alkaliphilum TaxID=2293317 RepID=A0A6I6D8L6_9FIRM|nr:YheC/YheD family protein [Candidatus Syntrophocurvum alkaliphilum]QGT99328.1 hypothetical protein SYNTR_0735 [Candidatus Syntrophocurvum alkaliphilum]
MINENDRDNLRDKKRKETPLVGVITARKKSEKRSNQFPSKREGRVFREMALEGYKKGITIYFFYPDGVKWKEKKINGYIYKPKSKPSWVKKVMPLPDIVYNRIVYRSLENKKEVKEILKKFEANPNIFLFNTRFLNKLELHDALIKHETSKQFIPETNRFSYENLKKYLHSYNEVFIKPKNNSTGKGIIKVIKANRGYYYSFAESKKNKWYSSPTIERLYRSLRFKVPNKSNYLIQMGIPLLKMNGRIFDLRAQVQKNGNGQWVLTGIAVRLAALGKFVTHIPNGGRAAEFNKVIKEIYKNELAKEERVINELKIITKQIPRILENELQINLGVLSLDLGIDTQGKMWIIEINSKPASFDEKDIRFRHLNYLTDYFLYINSNKED